MKKTDEIICKHNKILPIPSWNDGVWELENGDYLIVGSHGARILERFAPLSGVIHYIKGQSVFTSKLSE